MMVRDGRRQAMGHVLVRQLLLLMASQVLDGVLQVLGARDPRRRVTFAALGLKTREKSPFDKLRVISR